MELDPFNDSDFSSDESTDFDSPEKPSFVSRFICRGYKGNQVRLRVRFTFVLHLLKKLAHPPYYALDTCLFPEPAKVVHKD